MVPLHKPFTAHSLNTGKEYQLTRINSDLAMNYTYELTRLLQLVREVYDNCKMNSQSAGNRILVSKQLISMAMSDLADADIDTLIESLEVERYIQRTGSGQLVIPASFIEKDSWINNYAYYNA